MPVIYGKYSPPGGFKYISDCLRLSCVRRKEQSILSPLNCWNLLLLQVKRESRDRATLSDLYLNNIIPRFAQISEDSGRLFKKVRTNTHTHTEFRASLVLDFQNKSLHFLSLFHVQRCVFENVLTLRQSTAQRQADIIKSLSCFCPVPPSLLHLYFASFDLLTPNPMNSGPGKFLSVFLTEASFLSPLI